MLEEATTQDLKRLVELYPISNLRIAFPDIKGTKDEICSTIGEQRRYGAIIDFLDTNFGCCKQHIYIFDRQAGVDALPDALPEAARVFGIDGEHALYVARVQYSVVLRDPLEETTLDFLWPIRLEMTPQYLIAKFVVLEKNLSSYFERPSYLQARSIDEKTIVKGTDLFQKPADIHKGIKALWGEGFMDSIRAKYKKPMSMASEAMDEERGIREYNPELYEDLQEVPLLNMLFVIPKGNGTSVSAFLADPGGGYLAFPRYSDKVGDTDYVVRSILVSAII